MFFFELINNALEGVSSYVYPEVVKNIKINGIASDSRNVREGFLFAAIPGYRDNGVSYIQDAVALGAVVILTEASEELCRKVSSSCYVIRVNNVREAFALITAEFYSHCDRKLDLIGVTGTNGKTSTTHYIAHILNSLSVRTGIIGTLGGRLGELTFPTERTTPDILDLFGLFSSFAANDAKAAAIEVSSHALEMKRVAGLKFKFGVFTNLTEDHLDFHKNMSAYRKAKEKLFSQCETAVINSDDPYGREIIKNIPSRVITYGTGADADYRAVSVRSSFSGAVFDMITPDKRTVKISVSTPGMFSVYNALASAVVCTEYGFDAGDVAKALSSAPPIPGRFEPIIRKGAPLVIIDYAHTPDGIKNVIQTAREFTKGRLISVFGCGGDREKEKRSKMGEISAELSDYTVITSDNPRSENEICIANEIVSGLECKQCFYNIVINREKAIEHAIRCADTDDTVIIMGKGHEAYQQIGGIKYPSDDRSIVLSVLDDINDPASE